MGRNTKLRKMIKGYRKAIQLICLSALLLTATTSCAIDYHVLIGRRDCFQNSIDSGRSCRVQVLGIHLLTSELERGIILGYSDRTFYSAGAASAESYDIANTSQQSTALIRNPLANLKGELQGKPLAVQSRTIGFELKAGPRFGITAGVMSGARLLVDPETPIRLTMRCNSAATTNSFSVDYLPASTGSAKEACP